MTLPRRFAYCGSTRADAARWFLQVNASEEFILKGCPNKEILSYNGRMKILLTTNHSLLPRQ